MRKAYLNKIERTKFEMSAIEEEIKMFMEKELLFQLEQIENRNHIRIPSIRPNNNKSYPYTSLMPSQTSNILYFIILSLLSIILVLMYNSTIYNWREYHFYNTTNHKHNHKV